MIWGGAEEIEKKKFGGPSPENFFYMEGVPGKNKFISEISSAPPDHYWSSPDLFSAP